MTFVSTKRLESTIQNALFDWFSAEDFVVAPPCAVKRWRDSVYLELSCTVIKSGGNNQCEPMGVVGFRDSRILHQAFFSQNPDCVFDRSVDLQLYYGQIKGDWRARLICNQKEEVTVLLETIHRYYVDELMPALASYSDPHLLAQAYLDNLDKRYPSTDVAVIDNWGIASTALSLVRLHLPTHYAVIQQRLYPEFFAPLIPMYKEPLDRMIAFMDQDLSPSELVAAAEKILEEKIALMRG